MLNLLFPNRARGSLTQTPDQLQFSQSADGSSRIGEQAGSRLVLETLLPKVCSSANDDEHAASPFMSSSAIGLAKLLRHSRDKAVIDRYGLVRQFFIRQASSSSNAACSASSASRFASITLASTSVAGERRLKISWALSSSFATQGLYRSQSRQISTFARSRYIHTTSRAAEQQRPGPHDKSASDAHHTKIEESTSTSTQSTPTQPNPRNLENYSKFFRQLALSLPHLHRPTRDDFLNAATSFWQRMRIRFKWITIRSFRKYNADDISAFVTWFFMSQTLWLLVGT